MAIANSDGSIILSTKLDVNPISKALDKLKDKFASLKEQKATFEEITEAMRLQKQIIDDLNKRYNSLYLQEGPTERVKALGKEIKEETSALKELENIASSMGKKSTKSFDDMSNELKKFGKRVAGIIKSALIFSVLYKVMQSVVKLFNNILMSDEEFRQDWEELKAAFYAAAYPIVQLIVPAIKLIVQQVRDWAVSLGQIAAYLKGMSYSEYVEQAKASKQAADNYEKMAKDSKKTADNVEKQFASFDNIQTLSTGKQSQDNDYSNFDGLGKYDTSNEQNMLANLMSAIGGALTAMGIILLFRGAISWGLGFIIAGATAWSIKKISTKQFSEDPIINMLATITESVGLSLVAIGLILLIKGIYTWGLGFVVAGAAVWFVTEIATGEFSTDPVVDTLIKIMAIAGTALLALGLILCIFGQITPLSLGLIAAGAVSLAGAVALNNEAIVEAIRGPVGVIMAIAGGALIVIGLMLCLTQVGIPLGIGLILAGAGSLATVVAINHNAIVDWIKKAWEAAKSFWNRYIAPIFTAQFWLNLSKGCANGLISGFEAAVNGIIWLFEKMINFVVDGLNIFLRGVDDVISAVGNVFGADWGVATIPHANLGRVSIPRLAQGSVIPPNREFLAVLGDNTKEHEIVSPLSTMKQAFAEVMSEMGSMGQTTKEEHYYLGETELMSIMYKLVKGGERLQGKTLISGGNT